MYTNVLIGGATEKKTSGSVIVSGSNNVTVLS